MTDDNARKIANVILGAAVIGAAYYIVKTPPLRRLAWRLALTAATGTLPAWFSRELRQAWTESERPRDIESERPRDMMTA
jgi:uncharacterized protein (DUF2236 family)